MGIYLFFKKRWRKQENASLYIIDIVYIRIAYRTMLAQLLLTDWCRLSKFLELVGRKTCFYCRIKETDF